MKPEPSTLARRVIAYHEKFGRHASESALRHVDTGEFAAMLEASLAAGVHDLCSPTLRRSLSIAFPASIRPVPPDCRTGSTGTGNTSSLAPCRRE